MLPSIYNPPDLPIAISSSSLEMERAGIVPGEFDDSVSTGELLGIYFGQISCFGREVMCSA